MRLVAKKGFEKSVSFKTDLNDHQRDSKVHSSTLLQARNTLEDLDL